MKITIDVPDGKLAILKEGFSNEYEVYTDDDFSDTRYELAHRIYEAAKKVVDIDKIIAEKKVFNEELKEIHNKAARAKSFSELEEIQMKAHELMLKLHN